MTTFAEVSKGPAGLTEGASAGIRYSVFTKPWRDKPLPQLAAFIASLGFDAVELPVRPGFQVTPEAVSTDLAAAVEAFGAHGVRIGSVAAPLEEPIIAACGQAGIPYIRDMVRIGKNERYMAALDAKVRDYEALIPRLEDAGVTVGLQNHCQRMISSAMGLRYVVSRFDPQHVTAVLDFAHCGLAGEDPDEALDQVWPQVGIVNLKNACWVRKNGPETTPATWGVHWTTGPHGMADWPAAARAIVDRGYHGDVCLTAEYSNEDQLDTFIASDLAYARQCFADAGLTG